MAADPQQVFRVLAYRGVEVRLVNGRLAARCRHGPMPEDMRRFVIHFTPLIITELHAQEEAS